MYFINGRKFEPEKAIPLYHDGTFSDSSESFFLTKSGNIVRVRSSRWQGSHDDAQIISREDFYEYMTEFTPHPNRAAKALKLAGFNLDDIPDL